ncbi:ABC transporter ATP-binding protein [Rhodococcus sp. T2V]|uniref:ABC transporter ATP-binding protein n=1 Tax=Rhodococcus sp. T2V TaxID=3034164 RepID=UPI0023E2083A|nr:ABC transporter ATP-binding protein [Rhodococcus sp. T2V]MDF3312587.1 ABC transporter ATP-binding protein [Rhodococcus sp. T2V]
MTATLSIDDLTVRLPVDGGVVHAASGVSLDVPAGSVTALVGESGCGKSIAAAAIMGMLPEGAQVSGTITITTAGSAIQVVPDGGAPDRFRGRVAALIPQSPSTSLTPVRTARSQLQETIDTLGGTHTCEELAYRVGLESSALDLYPHELSGGMAQRVVLGAAIAADPAVIVADEPTSHLDRDLTDRTLSLLRELADAGAAVLLITHDLTSLLRTTVTDTIAVMYASRIMEIGPAAEVFADPWHDYTADLLNALPSRGLHPIPGSPPSLTNLPSECVYHLRRPSSTQSRGPTFLSSIGARTVRTRCEGARP